MPFYLSGYVCKHYFLKHGNCEGCMKLLQRKKLQFIGQPEMVFTYHKAFSRDIGDFGGLRVPSVALMNFISCCEDIFERYFLQIMHTSKICLKLDNFVFRSADDLSWFTVPECVPSLRDIVHSYMKMRIFYAVKFFNQSLAHQPRNKRCRKALKLEHL